MPDPRPRPKVFLSYAWGDEEYDERVLRFAEDLRASGIDVVFDKWHLEEGHDAYDFMEATVKDPSVTHVLVLCEPRYAKKADERRGGVGAETLIISPQVYRDAKQVKFIPVIMERNDDGTVAVPTYMDGRKYIDLSDAGTEGAGYDRLIRRLWGRPELVPPPLGEMPSYLDDSRAAMLTGRTLDQYKDAVRRGRAQTAGLLSDYLGRLLDAYRAEQIGPGVTDHAGLKAARDASIDRFQRYRDEFADAMRFLAEHAEDGPAIERVHRFFEEVACVRFAAKHATFGWELANENLAFLSRELLLYAVSPLLDVQRFAALDTMLRPLLVSTDRNSGGVLRSVVVFDPGFPFMRQNSDPFTDPVAARLAARATLPRVPKERLRDAELYLTLRSYLHPEPDGLYGRMLWNPLGARSDWNVDGTALWARLKDPGYRGRFAVALGFGSATDLAHRIRSMPAGDGTRQGHMNCLSWFSRGVVAQLFDVNLGSTS
jgi:hypothetical protein